MFDRRDAGGRHERASTIAVSVRRDGEPELRRLLDDGADLVRIELRHVEGIPVAQHRARRDDLDMIDVSARVLAYEAPKRNGPVADRRLITRIKVEEVGDVVEIDAAARHAEIRAGDVDPRADNRAVSDRIAQRQIDPGARRRNRAVS